MFNHRLGLAGPCVVLCIALATAPAAAQPEPSDAEGAAEGEEGTKQQRRGGPIPEEVDPDDVRVDSVVGEADDDVVVQVSRTTPVFPEDPTRPTRAYQLYWELDLPILGAGAALAAARLFRTGEGAAHASCLDQIDENGSPIRLTSCDSSDINRFDRLVAGRYDRSWATVSDYGLLGLAVAPPLLLIADEGLLVGLNDVVVVYESALWAVAFSGLATLSGGRARPYVYGTEAPADVRTGGNGALSFVSSHTSVAFALAMSTFWTVERRHGGDALTWSTFGVGMGTASLVAVSRVLAGSHFPTDVIAGAVVGMSVGTIIPMLHGSPVRVAATAGPERAEAQLSYSF